MAEEPPPTDAAVEFAGLAKTIGKAMHVPEDYDTKLIHSDIEKGYEPDIMVTSAIPFDMREDFNFLKTDSEKAKGELVELEKRIPSGNEEDAIAKEDRQLIDQWRQYNFEKAVIESRILSDDDILAWQVMTPFCASLPEKLIETFMAKEGKRAEHGVQNIGSILHREQLANSEGQTFGKLDRLMARIRKR